MPDVANWIEKIVPRRSTTLFFSLLIFTMACVYLGLGWVTNSQWMEVSMFILGVYAYKRHQTNKLTQNGNGDSNGDAEEKK